MYKVLVYTKKGLPRSLLVRGKPFNFLTGASDCDRMQEIPAVNSGSAGSGHWSVPTALVSRVPRAPGGPHSHHPGHGTDS